MLTQETIKQACIEEYIAKERRRSQHPDDLVRWYGISQMIDQNPEESASEAAMQKERIRKTLAFLNQHDLPGADDEILDLGCGSGVYTVEFATCAKRVTALDYSRPLLKKAEDRVQDAGLSNVEFELCDISGLNPEEKNWLGKYDLVFSSLSPPGYRYESIRKTESMSRKYCCLQMLLETVFYPGMEIISSVFGTRNHLFIHRIKRFRLLQNFLNLEGGFPST